MKFSNWLPVSFIIGFVLFGCRSADPPVVTRGTPTREAVTQASNTPVTAEPSLTPMPTDTVSAVVPTTLPNAPTSTSSPSPTPTLYPDAWVSGIIWHENEDGPTIYAGNSSVGVFNAQISYEPSNETVADEIAQFAYSTLVVFYGDYTPQGQNKGHIVVERAEQVNLDYSEETPFTESYSDPYGFSFSYPENWTLRSYSDGEYLELFNLSAEAADFSGPGIEYDDPTSLRISFLVEKSSIETYLQNLMDSIEADKNAIPNYSPTITVTQHEFNSIPVTQITIDQLIYSYFGIFYILELENQTTLVIAASEESSPIAERLLDTLTLTPRPTSSSPTNTPEPTAIPVTWASGLLWDEARTILYVGNSTIGIFDTRISFEALNETAADSIANIPVGALVVFYGYFTPSPDGEWPIHMVVEEAEQVHLSFDDETNFSAEFNHRDNIFSFSYPEEWTLIDDGDAVFLFNRSEAYAQYSGPGIEYYDPTAIRMAFRLETTSLDDFIESHRENSPSIAVSEIEINDFSVTRIEEESYLYGSFLYYVFQVNDNTVLTIGFDSADEPFAERLVSTLSINQQ